MTRSTLQRSTAIAAALAGALAIPGTAAAASFQILEQSPALQGTSFAGTASQAADASTVFFNPAAMGQLEGSNFTAGGNLIRPKAEFSDDGSNVTGPDDTTDETGFVPNVYYVRPLNEQWTFGLGLSAPFGLASSYDDDWVGRYHATDSELALLNINPTFAYRVDDRLSLGVGLNYQRIDATLENKVDLGGSDGNARIEGDDDGVGLDLSLFYRVTERTDIGVLWRQGVEFTLDGTVDFDPAPGGPLQDGDIQADIELPDTLTVSVSHALNNRWSLHGDIAWTEWSSIQEVEINRDDGTNVSTLDLEYDDTMRYAVGATYSDGGPWTWRGGVAFDEAPQTDPEFVTPRIPDEDRTWLSFGFNYATSPTSSIDFAYTHILVDDIRIDNTDDNGHTLTGDFDASVDILALQGNWRF